ncbi:Golgi membrane protein 1 isoform X2 [Vanacampus margaritifer]
MGGLVNGRRGGRSPPLLIGALVACILLLGFNYWVSSSRTLELQTKLYELEGQLRRGAAERGADEVKKFEFQKEIQRQKDQIDLIENHYKKQLQGVQNTCSQEKETLQHNISTSTKTIQEFKGQLNQMNDDLGTLQKELHACQGNVKSLNDKLTYDMTHCNSQILTQKELCDERVAAAKLEAQKKMAKLALPAVAKDEKAENDGVKADGTEVNVSPKESASTLTAVQANTNSIFKEQGVTVGTEDIHLLDMTKEALKKSDVALLAPANKSSQVDEGTAQSKADPGMGHVLISPGKADKPTSVERLDGEFYDRDDKQAPGGGLDKQKQPRRDEAIDKVMEDELADYNGDDDNEGEFEADKQAELAQN